VVALKEIYHSALRDDLKIAGELDCYETGGSIVFRHDITHGMHPNYFKQADAIYSEPAWKDGYTKFLDRAGAKSGAADFRQYLSGMRQVILTLGKPTYVVLGRHMLRHLQPDHVVDIKLHGYKCLLGVWHAEPPAGPKTNNDAVSFVADQYRKVLDFSCGYGNVARAMKEHGKQFICSDINRRCVYYVATEVMGYEKNHVH
jgi:hypothetical protein